MNHIFRSCRLNRKLALRVYRKGTRYRAFSVSQWRNSHVVHEGRPFRLAVLGSGPAGFYTAYKILSKIENAVVDMYEHLPVPFGLVRYGVAPDHPEVKNCEDKFDEVASSPNFNLIGNIDVGKDLPLASLRGHYDAILFAYGASRDRKLGIPGESTLSGIYSARDFVGWYNGLPELAALAPDLESSDEAVIIGQGNVALDVARTLLTDVDSLRKTDITDYALAALSKNKVRRVHVVGRRGPMQSAFTIKEVRELMNLPSVRCKAIDPTLFPPEIDRLPRTAKRLTQLLMQGSNTSSDAEKSWSLDYLLSPASFNASSSSPSVLSAVTFTKNVLQGPDTHDPSAKIEPTADKTTIGTSLAFRSIGYKSQATVGMEDIGVDFDNNRGIIPNDNQGRVVSPSSSAVIPGLYCSGWVKRGPAGVIANTMEDAFATAEAIAEDWHGQQPFMAGGMGWSSLKAEAQRRGLRSVSWDDWKKIDAAEKKRGALRGKPREKFTSVSEMLQVLD